MSINNFIYDIRIFKYHCVLAFFHGELEEAEKLKVYTPFALVAVPDNLLEDVSKLNVYTSRRFRMWW